MAQPRISIDGPSVTPDEALELAIYHARMAMSLYDVITATHDDIVDEIGRVSNDGRSYVLSEFFYKLKKHKAEEKPLKLPKV